MYCYVHMYACLPRVKGTAVTLSMQECPVIYPSVIVRCRVCRSYINPFVTFIDARHWRCNLCFRPNSCELEMSWNRCV